MTEIRDTARQADRSASIGKISFGRSAFNEPDASPATRPATAIQKNHAVWTCGAIVLSTALFVPFAEMPMPSFTAFFPAYQTAIIITYLITAYLIFAQFRVTRSLALLYLAGGCLYTGAILVAQFLTVPGMFVPQGPVFGGTQATIWLWCFWHFGPSAGIFLYVFSEWRWPGCTVDDTRRVAALFGAALIALVGASLAAITVFHDFLPVLDLKGDFHRITTTGIAPAIQLMIGIALLVLWRVTAFRTVLQVWLAVVLIALLCDNTITMLGANRLSVGWYVGRFNALISATITMLVYLAEINRAYLKSTDVARQLAASNAQLETKVDEARLDGLTGLPGRSLFLELGQSLCARGAAREMGTAMLFIDLDGFKKINDRFGHEYGDTVLVRVAAALRSTLRDADTAGRVGGDEFVVCLTAPSEVIEKVATQVAQRIVRGVAEIGSGLGCSVGISLSRVGLMDMDTAIRQADEAMYDAKKQGKNCFAVHGRRALVAIAS